MNKTDARASRYTLLLLGGAILGAGMGMATPAVAAPTAPRPLLMETPADTGAAPADRAAVGASALLPAPQPRR